VVAGAVGIGLTAWWLIPFALGQAYTTDMGYTKVLGFPHLLFPASARWVLAADLVGVVAMVYRRNRVALFLVIMGGISAAVVCLDPTPKLYNVRFLPLWFLCAYLMAGYALSEVVAAVARWNRRRRLPLLPRDGLNRAAPDLAKECGCVHRECQCDRRPWVDANAGKHREAVVREEQLHQYRRSLHHADVRGCEPTHDRVRRRARDGKHETTEATADEGNQRQHHSPAQGAKQEQELGPLEFAAHRDQPRSSGRARSKTAQ